MGQKNVPFDDLMEEGNSQNREEMKKDNDRETLRLRATFIDPTLRLRVIKPG